MQAFRTLGPNIRGRDFVTGDIHGAFAMLDQALERAEFDPSRDRLFSVGDLTDRGDQNERALEFLEKPWFHAVQSNHQWAFLQIVKPDGTYHPDGLYHYGGYSVGWIAKAPRDVLAKLYAKLAALPYALEFETARGTVGVLHAEVPKSMDWQSFKSGLMAGNKTLQLWAIESRMRIRGNDASGVRGVGRVFCGHTPQHNGPTRLGNVFYIDTGAVFRLLGHNDCAMMFTAAATSTQSLEMPNAEQRSIDLRNTPSETPFSKYAL